MKENVLSLLEQNTKLYGERIALGKRNKYGWKELTYKGLGLLTKQFASYLITDLQMQKGEKLAILSESMPEMGACLFAAVISGMVTVPLDNKLTIYELESILSSCQPSVLAVSQANLEKGLELQKRISSIKHIVIMDEPRYASEFPSLYTLPTGRECKWRHRSLRDTALIIYTSGTTGAPKGVQTTFGNMTTQVLEMSKILPEILPHENVNLLSILPMNHLFELTVGFFTFLNHGFSIYYTQSLKPKDILEVMTEKKIQFMITVPAFLKLLKTSIESELNKKPKIVQFLFKLNYKIAKFMPINLRRIMFSSIHKKFGGEFFGCISGGAPLDVNVGKFFERIGVKVYQGYGLSETSPVVAVNRGKCQDLKSVGPALKSFEAKIDKDTGELMLKGPSVMKGYYNRKDLTNEVISSEGWLHTGDIAQINPKTKLIYITGRIKNMIVLSGGKKVFPEEIESVLEQSPNFAEVCVTGISKSGGEKNGCEEIAAIIVPTTNYAMNFENFDKLETAIRKEVKFLSTHLAPYKRPISIVVRQESLPRTTTRKLKRNMIKELISTSV